MPSRQKRSSASCKLRVIHRDLKLRNILVDAQGHIAVADYGLCKDFAWYKKGDRAYSVCGTKQYMAPEMIIGKGYSYIKNTMDLKIAVFWALEEYSLVEDYQCFRGPCSLHDQDSSSLWRGCSSSHHRDR
ncbi:serine/threonine-protein kinase gad8-like isoform X2 [Zootermopsis nevadensis]|uniref:serine/threonine-protein kinase gad8-like isoform X2 n=1 Tax=Zootermopsis nevadensis TaxID=136037 RepID=UPI000B8E3A88|nr:serine/threonine-protein kinase gad8-like isoform X2 [Zootermopsis nevadensis]